MPREELTELQVLQEQLDGLIEFVDANLNRIDRQIGGLQETIKLLRGQR